LLEILHRGGEPVGASEDYRIRYHGGAQAAASGEVAAPTGHGCAIITIRHGDENTPPPPPPPNQEKWRKKGTDPPVGSRVREFRYPEDETRNFRKSKTTIAPYSASWRATLQPTDCGCPAHRRDSPGNVLFCFSFLFFSSVFRNGSNYHSSFLFFSRFFPLLSTMCFSTEILLTKILEIFY